MPDVSSPSTVSVAIVGNPNCGKSTLFNMLVGVRQRVANYPGVTVEKKTGVTECGARQVELIDLPGLYSLRPRSLDEQVAVDVLVGRKGLAAPVDAIICVVDACNLQRHLYLVSQVLELGLPVVLAVNMIDVAQRSGVRIDVEGLSQRLGIPEVATQANRGVGVDRLREALGRALSRPAPEPCGLLPPPLEDEVSQLEALLGASGSAGERRGVRRFLARRMLFDIEGDQGRAEQGEVAAAVQAARRRLAEQGMRLPSIEVEARYRWARRLLDGVWTKAAASGPSLSDRIDRVLTHRVWGTVAFVLVMLVVFQAVFSWAEPLMTAIDQAVAWTGGLVDRRMADGALKSLLIHGVLGGVGGVLVFLPQILILFGFIAVLEDCGYMARAAYLMDKFMVRVGLSGKSFIPMLCSFACAIPGIMAARVIEDDRDRLTTILVIPLLTCSARLPVYALLIAAFIPPRRYLGGLVNLQGLTLAALYALGIAAAVIAALVFKRTLLRGRTPPFVLELPTYQWPSLRNIVYRMVERGLVFVRCAGTIILAVSILVWAGLYFPHNAETIEAPFRAREEALRERLAQSAEGSAQRAALEAELGQMEARIAAAYQRQSLLGRAARFIQPVFKPLGWDWRIGSAVIASFPAREVVVATLGVVFNVGQQLDPEGDEDLTRLSAQLHAARWEFTGRPLFTIPVAVSLMVFYALCAQCVATLAVIRRETNSWRWPLFTFGYMTALAYVGALVAYQTGTWIARW
ncbi:MAG TPA: ferrous iron transport protein B [Planctomycetaceae bacterium]|nr:ferrous iron transport protein B [Planctomycetaceae bacterium]